MTSKLSKGKQSLTLEIPEELVKSADLYGELLDMDRATVLLHWLQTGAEREMLQLVSDGELSTGKFVEVMGLTYFDVHPLAQKYGIELGPSDEQIHYMNEKYGGKLANMFKTSPKAQKE